MKKIKYQKPRLTKNKISIRYLTNRRSRGYMGEPTYLAVQWT